MNNIINLTKGYIETIFTMRRQLIILIVFGIMLGVYDTSFIAYGAGISIMILVLQVLAVEDASGIDFLVSILPIRKKEYVISRYIGGVIAIVVGTILVTCSYYLAIIFNRPEIQMPYISLLATTIISCMIIVSINIPVVLKCGAVKGRVFVTFLNVAGIFIPIIIAAKLSEYRIFNTIVSNPIILVVFILLIGILILYVSYLISFNLYKNKEVKK